MSLPTYQCYRDSGIAWLDNVPTHWDVKAVYRVASFNDDVLPESTSPDYEIEYVEISGVDPTKGITETELLAFADAPSRARRKVRSGDIIISTVRTYLRSIAPVHRASSSFVASTGFCVVRARDCHAAFLGYAVRAERFISDVISRSVGVSYPAINASELVRIPIALPPPDEQGAIAAFLDRETAKINALVEEQQRMIALLKEKRQAVISHAVTKGLNPDAPMKDSGVEWLGDVPSHWDIRRIKTILKCIKQGWSPQCDAEPVDSFDAWGVLKVGCVNGGHFNPSENKALPSELEPLPELAVRAGDVLVSRANTRDLVGSAALVESDYQRLLLSDKLYCLDVDRDQIDPGFLALYLQADAARGQIEVAATGASSSMLNIGQAVIREMPIAIPSPEEQRKILAHINQRRVAFVSLISEASNAISILAERRAALISAAVTGKIDVRGSAKVLPFPVDRARARRLIAAEIIDRSAHQATFGRTKLQKLLFLAEAHANVNELAGRYVRMPYGPLDQDMIDEIEGAAVDMGFAVDDPGNRKMVRYRPIATRGRNRGELAEWLGDDRVAKLDKLITDFTDLDTHAAEAVATLYAVWNDALIDGETPSDDWIVNGFLTAWNKKKAENFDRHELPHWLGWMRRHGLVPTGAGPKTGIGGLFV